MKEELRNQEPTDFCRLMDQQNFPFLKDKINLEDRLDVSLSEVEDVDGLQQINQFNSCFKLKNGHDLPNPMLDISFDAFEKLYNEAFALRSQGKYFITGLRILYGLTGNNLDVKLMFIPVCYNWNAGKNWYDVKLGTKYYYTSRNDFQPYQGTENVEQNYKDNITIFHDNDTDFHDFNTALDDVKGVTYPFQTIYSLMCDNKSDGDNFVTVKNALYRRSNGTLSAKHSLLLRSIQVAIGFRDKFANRSHLCPPGCDELTKAELNVYSQGPTTCP